MLITAVLVVLVVVYRDRLYLRDPLGRLERNGAAVAGARVFINYSNDVLVQENQGRRMFLVQNWSRAASTPSELTCLQGMLCLTPADRIVDAQTAPGQAQMSSREVSLIDSDGAHLRVTIR